LHSQGTPPPTTKRSFQEGTVLPRQNRRKTRLPRGGTKGSEWGGGCPLKREIPESQLVTTPDREERHGNTKDHGNVKLGRPGGIVSRSLHHTPFACVKSQTLRGKTEKTEWHGGRMGRKGESEEG